MFGVSLRVDIRMGTLSYSFGFFPVRKISSLIFLKPNKKYNRVPSTLYECMDNPTPKTAVFYRPWLVLILLPPLIFYGSINHGSFWSKHSGSIIVESNNTKVLERPKGSDIGVEVFDDVNEDTVLKSTMVNTTNITGILPHSPPVCEIVYFLKPGNITVNLNVSNEAAFAANSLVKTGGYYKPSDCQTRHRLAIIVPYRHREENLAIFLTNIHPFLIKQQIEYRIYVIEQSGQQKFNKGRLFNAGFDQAKDEWDCFVFHDVDLLPVDGRILYNCPSYPKLMSTTVYNDNRTIKFTEYFGGVTAMTDENFVTVNGYSNKFWGWGGEDNDMFWRIRISNLPMTKYNKEIGRYFMLSHVYPEINRKRFDILNSNSKSLSRLKEDGLSNFKYTVVFMKRYSLFTHIIVDINPYKDPVP